MGEMADYYFEQAQLEYYRNQAVKQDFTEYLIKKIRKRIKGNNVSIEDMKNICYKDFKKLLWSDKFYLDITDFNEYKYLKYIENEVCKNTETKITRKKPKNII